MAEIRYENIKNYLNNNNNIKIRNRVEKIQNIIKDYRKNNKVSWFKGIIVKILGKIFSKYTIIG